jgi:hypothetical protein
MPDLFKQILPAILKTKENVFEDDPTYSDYNPFLVNRSLSYHLDCLLPAQQMNINHFLDKCLQNAYLINSIRPMSRKFRPWIKKEKIDDLECVKEYFGYSNARAKEALTLLTDSDIVYIKNKTNKGGVTKK